VTGSKGSCITLAALAGAAATITGGVIAASSSHAEFATATSGAEVTTVGTVQTRQIVTQSSVVSNAPARGIDRAPAFKELTSFEDLNRAIREATNIKLTPEYLDQLAAQAPAPARELAGPVPCDSCDPENLGGFIMEMDTLASGSNQPACDDPTLVTDFWQGANDHCVFPGQWGNFEDPANKDTQIPDFNGSVLSAPNVQQVVNFCGRSGRLDNALTTRPDDRDNDPDVYEFQVTSAPLDMVLTGYADTEGIRVIMTYCFQCAVDTGNRTEILQCSDGYGVSTQWDTIEFRSEPNCADGMWSENLIPGYYYILVTPLSSVPNDCGIWYNIELKDIDPNGPCCLGATCVDDTLKSSCIAQGGIFGGAENDCGSVTCCDVLANIDVNDIDFEEGPDGSGFTPLSGGLFPFAEKFCNETGATEVNEGCIQDSEGDPVPLASRITTLTVDGNPGQVIDFEAETTGGNEYIVVGYAGTPDDWAASFTASAFTKGFQDDDFFIYEQNSQDPLFVETLFDVPYAHLPFQLRDLGSNPFMVDCDVVGFLTPGFQPSCERSEIDFCYNPGVHGFGVASGLTDGISCQTPWVITVSSQACADNACCLKDGTCVDNMPNPTCEFDMGGNPGGDFSSCCAVTCTLPCDEQNDPSGASVTDDDCTNTDPFIGDLVNSGCEAPDGDQDAYWSTLDAPNDQTWCGFNGTFILTLPGEPRDLNSDNDYYEATGLSAQATDTEMTITITPQITTRAFIVLGRNKQECPAAPVDNIRDLPETIGFTFAEGVTSSATLCMPDDDFMLVIDNTVILDCGHSYTISLSYRTGGCFAACCDIAGGGCTEVVVARSDQGVGTARSACQNQGGTFHGLGTRCSDDNGGDPAIPICCTIDAPQDAVLDADPPAASCAPNNSAFLSDPNRGCVGTTLGNFQQLGTLSALSGGGGAEAGDSVSIAGSSRIYPRSFPAGAFDRDVDFYEFTVDPSSSAEAVFTWNANFDARVIVIGDDDLNPATECDIQSDSEARILFDETNIHNKCDQNNNGDSVLFLSGLETTDNTSLCLDAGEKHYIYITPIGQPQCIQGGPNTAQYAFSMTLFECRGGVQPPGVGACCLDAALCTDSVGFLECTLGLGGSYLHGVDCPTGALQGTLCVGTCCIDDEMGGLICMDGETFEACCELNGDIFALGSFVGYNTGAAGEYEPAPDCSTNPCVVVAAGVCCYGCDPVPTPGSCPDASAGVGASCVDSDEADCIASGGVFREGLTCADETDPCQCPADLNGDGVVDVFDFADLTAGFGNGIPNCASRSEGDINCDGVVDVFDFAELTANFGCDSNPAP
jgi:hypothetical protein